MIDSRPGGFRGDRGDAMTAAVIPMRWAVTRAEDCCSCCGRPITGKPMWVEVIDGGASVAAPGLGPDQSDSGYMGFFPVGRGCARKHFRGFAVEIEATDAR